ncbi:FtsX-like permease family protein [Fulvivirga sp. M361]|uniref:ABC transporter permease n=1 Tax=Fulvivirga sp. M361 TaxID=2594266 RepID=UPI001179E258|nr:ABC transporter permease [Fulvivirga sp. M361]TRX48914.1 FtsX-like permease family protein [Fulvivirga sp. M361]
MVKNFIKTAFRSLVKNGLLSFINIFGLSLAIGCTLVVYIFVDFAFSQDDFHENREHIFLLNNVVSRDGKEQVWGDSPAPIGEMMESDFPQIEYSVRLDGRGAVMKYEDKVFKEYVRFADPEFLNMFTFPLETGTKDALNSLSRVIISKSIAEKYFGDLNPIDEQIVLVINGRKESFTIGGVAKPFPKTASFRFDLLLNFDKKLSFYPKESTEDWTKFIGATFIKLHRPEDINAISSGMDKYVKLQNAADEDWPANAYIFEPLTTLSQNSYKIRGDISGGDDPVGRIVLLTIAAFMMSLACFNYMNISISSSTKRLKEIGVRKVIGGTKRQLVLQFIGENLIICFFALALGAVWARTLFAPWFDSQFSIGLELDFYQNIRAWGFLIGLLLVAGVASGAYPAFYIASFKPVNIFRGRQKFGKKNVFTKVFLTIQFILSLVTIVFGVAIIQNTEYQKGRDWGYDQQQTLVVPVADEKGYTALKNDLLLHPDITQMAGSANHIGKSVGLSVIDLNDTKYEIRHIGVGYGYLETLDLRLKQGRFFDDKLLTDQDGSVVINQTFATDMGWDNPLGRYFDVDSLTYQVVGVVEDFHYHNFFDEIEPTFFKMAKEEKFKFLSLRIRQGKAATTEARVKELWKKHEPDMPYTAFFQDEVFDDYFNAINGHARIMGFTAMLATILSCMGLFGLVSLNVMARIKEFSIRKVLGAGIASIFNCMNQQYILLIAIACIIGLPASYFLLKLFFNEAYKYHIPITATPLLISTAFLLLMALITVSSQLYKVLVTNPAETLKNE